MTGATKCPGCDRPCPGRVTCPACWEELPAQLRGQIQLTYGRNPAAFAQVMTMVRAWFREQDAEMDATCEHGLSEWLCEGPGHYPPDL